MISAPLPENEELRLRALELYQVLDSPPEERFQDLVKLAAQICGTPIALISLIDKERQWFKARVGLDAPETPREVSFCAHAILEDGVFVIRDTLEDQRFRDNPLVTEEPEIRFYAGTPLRTPEGFGLGTLCVIDRVPRDLTDAQVSALRTLGSAVISQLEVRKVARELATQNQRLAELDELKDQFIASVSHELRTPLTTISSFVELLSSEEQAEGSHVQREMLSVIGRNVDRLTRLVNDLLLLAHLDAKEAEFEPHEVDLTVILEQEVKALQPAAEAASVKVSVDAPIPAMVEGSALRLQDVVQNLLANAIKYTPEGGTIAARIIHEGADRIGFEVEDTGIGIPQDERSELFRRFFRASNVPDAAPGTGLGLVICRAIVELHGGTIDVTSAPGRGTTVRVLLPTDPSAHDERRERNAS